MQPQGQVFNTAHIDALVDRINSVNQCAELQELVNEVYATVQAQLDGIAAQIAALQPILQLLELPTTLTAVINWIKNFVTSFLGPYIKPIAIYAQQVALLTAAMVRLAAAIEAAAGRITSCSINVPELTPPAIPPLPPLEDL